MSHSSPPRREFEARLRRLIQEFGARLSVDEMCSAAEAALSSVVEPDARPASSADARFPIVERPFTDPDALKAEIDELLRIKAFVVQEEVPLMTDVLARIGDVGAGVYVDLKGRTVQKTAAGIVVQLDEPNDELRRQLLGLPEQLRDGPPPSLSNAFSRRPITLARSRPTNPAGDSVPTLADSRPTDRPSKRWDLEQTPFRQVLLDLVGKGATGMLVVDGDGAERLMSIHQGELLDIESHPPQPRESLEALLAAAGTISEQQASEVRDYARTHGISTREALVNLGAVKHEELRVGTRTRARYIIGQLWTSGGEARFHPREHPERLPLQVPLDLNKLVFNRLVECFDASKDDTDAAEDPFTARRIRLADSRPPQIDRIPFNAVQTDLLDIRFGAEGLPLSKVYTMARNGRPEVLAALVTLTSYGALATFSFSEKSRVLTRSIEQVNLLYTRLANPNHFDFLGCHWSAHDQEVEGCYAALEKKLSPEVMGELDPEAQARAEAVRERARKAYEVLRDPSRRARHRKEVVDPFKVENSVSMFERQADTAKLRRDIESAVDFYRRLLEIRPDHAVARGELPALEALLRSGS